MPNQNQFFSEAGTFLIDTVIKGQTPLAFYDPLAQIALQPEIRKSANGKIGAVLPYPKTSVWGLFSQLQAHLGSATRTVHARKFWWAEYDQFQSFSFAVLKSNASVPAGGVGVTVAISRSSISQTGNFVKAIDGFKAIVKENNQQNVDITAVTATSTGYNITFRPINGQVLDLTKKGQYTIILQPMRNYNLTTTPDEIRGQGLLKNPPALYESYVQKYENRLDVDESELDGYVYDKDIMIARGLDPNGKEIQYFDIPALSLEIESWLTINRLIKTLFNERDRYADQDFDGLIPTARKYGLFNMAYDSFLGGSFKAMLFAMIKSIRKTNGSNEYMMLRDFNFGLDWSESIAALVKQYGQNLNYSLFGSGGTGARDFEHFSFNNFAWGNFKFLDYQIDAFDDYQIGAPLEHFCALLPAKSYVDTDGNKVPILTYCNLVGSEPAKTENVWMYDFRPQGKRKASVFAKDCFGIEIHKPTALGLITRGQ